MNAGHDLLSTVELETEAGNDVEDEEITSNWRNDSTRWEEFKKVDRRKGHRSIMQSVW
jgi:hypothetical protein